MDASGGVLSGATVTATHPVSGTLVTRISDGESRFFRRSRNSGTPGSARRRTLRVCGSARWRASGARRRGNDADGNGLLELTRIGLARKFGKERDTEFVVSWHRRDAPD